MKGLGELILGIKSGYAYFYCESQEVQKTITDISEGLAIHFSKNRNGIEYKVKVWDFESTTPTGESQYNDPNEMLNALECVQEGTDTIPVGTVIIAKNYNWFLVDDYGNCDKSKTAWLLNRAAKFSSPDYRKVLIIVGNASFDKAIPDILKRDFAQIEFELPREAEIESIYKFIVDSAKENPKFQKPDEKTKKRIIAGARGLSHSEIIKVFSYSLVKGEGVFDPRIVEELRSIEINSTPGLSLGKHDKKLEDLKGYEVAKEIVDEWIDDPEAKGILVLGPAGVGKTHFCQSLASHYDRPLIEVEFAQLMGDGLVGQAEKAMKKALDVISANANEAAPVIVFIDEIEKGLAGTSGAGNSGGTRDGGTTDRSNAQFLKFLSDARPKGIFIVASCNDVEKLPAAFVRTERWDVSPIFVDLPNKVEQEAILEHYQKEFKIKDRPADMASWTGAEIKAWCKLATKKISKGKPANEADELIVPVAKTMSREIDYLRKWKEGKTVPANRKTIIDQKKVSSRKLDM